MTEHTSERRQMRALAVVLVVTWTAAAIAIASAYRPGGPVDIVVVLACFLPVLVAAMALEWPPEAASHRDRVALVWVWLAALLFAIPVLYGVASTLAAAGPQSLVPSAEAAYAGIVALFSLSVFSVSGFVHARREALVFQRVATLRTIGLSMLITFTVAAAFGLVAFINDQALRNDEPRSSRYGPTDPDLVPPLCDEAVSLGKNAIVRIAAASSEDNVPRGTAILEGRRGGIDEAWGGSWGGLDGAGQAAYLRVGSLAWVNRGSDDPEAPGTTWQETQPGLFRMAGPQDTTMDGPPHALVSVPRGSIVAEDLGLDIVEGARARHCRTFINGPTALSAFLPLRWLLDDEDIGAGERLRGWRGELDWWVFSDGQLGRAAVEISGLRAETGWRSDGVRAVLEAQLEAVNRERPVDVTAIADAPNFAPRRSVPVPARTSAPAGTSDPMPTPRPSVPAPILAPVASTGPEAALESAAP